MQQTFRVDSLKAILLTVFGGCFLLSALALITVGSCFAGVVCLLVTLLYLGGAVKNAAVICIDKNGISKKVLWFTPRGYTWTQIREVGVFGTKLFNQKNPKKAGTLYLYCSSQVMTDNERFKMILNWPPKQIYFAFSPTALEVIRCFWGHKITEYNIGELTL